MERMTSLKEKVTKVVEVPNRPVVDLRDYLNRNKHPVLCVGPMSRGVVDAVIKCANDIQMPIPLIASRRQIECGLFGGGYVENWSTTEFSNYVIQSDKGGFVPLCRDHGGPWQGSSEEECSDAQAMERAKSSILEDIASGFDFIHIDPSIKGEGRNTDPDTIQKIQELYLFTCETARKLNRQVEIEIGGEQQSGHFSDPQELVQFLKVITSFCEEYKLQRPLFCVIQTGTLVKEMCNVGLTEGRRNESYDQKYAVESLEKQIAYLADIAFINGVFVKEHNGDYLSDGSMSLRRKLSLGGVNIAPELGVFESKTLVHLCLELGLPKVLEQMLEVFYVSRKWEKWLRQESKASDLDKAIIAGHYTFSSPEFLAIRSVLEEAAQRAGFDLHEFLVSQHCAALRRMSWNLGYFEAFQPQIANNRSIISQVAVD